MALDYSARRQVSRNRPKKRPIGRYVLLVLAGVSVVYGAGVATGWLLFGRGDKAAPQAAAPSPAAATAKQDAGKAPAGSASTPTGPAATAEGTDLTFFNTLPKGDKGIMGSGINPQHQAGAAPAGTSAAQPATPQPAQKAEKAQTVPASPDKPKARPEGANPSAAAENYAVQVASYQDRKDAEELKETLEKRGFSVRISETRLQDKGTRYRVKVGKGLHREDAGQLAAKLGGNAMVVSE